MSADIRFRFEIADAPGGVTGAAPPGATGGPGPFLPPGDPAGSPFDPYSAALIRYEQELRRLATEQAYRQQQGTNLPQYDRDLEAQRRFEKAQRNEDIEQARLRDYGETPAEVRRRAAAEEAEMRREEMADQRRAAMAVAEDEKHQRRYERDMEVLARIEAADQRRQERDENWLARREAADALQAEREQQAHERRQERDEDWLARREVADQRQQEREQEQWQREQAEAEAAMTRVVEEEERRREQLDRDASRAWDRTQARMDREGRAEGARQMAATNSIASSLGIPGVGQFGQAGMMAMAGNPAGAAAAGIQGIQEVMSRFAEMIEKSTERLKKFSASIQDVAGNDYVGAVTKQQELFMSQFGVVGDALGKNFTAQWTSIFDEIKAFSKRGREIQGYSPELSMANAMSEVRDLRADIREAQNIGPEMARLTDAQSRLLTEIRDLMLPVKRYITEKLADFTDNAATNLKEIRENYGNIRKDLDPATRGLWDFFYLFRQLADKLMDTGKKKADERDFFDMFAADLPWPAPEGALPTVPNGAPPIVGGF